ncbi:MAG: radical SAM protein [Planctomycetes bacterium]|nr:radical SAM protein [Planctomycetota bacterium]
MAGDILLVNPNRMRPPVAPIALDLLGGALEAAGFGVRLADLALAPDPEAALDEALADPPLLVAITCRNIDDSHFASGAFRLPEVKGAVAEIRARTDRPIVLGGVGFSILPGPILRFTGADAGIAGDGETALVDLARRIADGGDVGGAVIRSEPVDLRASGSAPRRHVDNLRYLREGGAVGFETKRGCPRGCIYCADPIAKGRNLRLRRPEDVAEEIAGLADAGITHFHTCDSEFNVPGDHAVAVCHALAARGLGDRIRWYAYCTPGDFTVELAEAMARAGCAGINFGVDHADPDILSNLGRTHGPDAIAHAARCSREMGIAAMFDLLLGGPGDTRGKAAFALAFLSSIDPVSVGVSWGIRIYPGTELARRIRRDRQGLCRGLVGPPGAIESFLAGEDEALLLPLWYRSPDLGEGFEAWLEEEVGHDPRFLVSSSRRAEAVFNYNDNDELCRLIREGERGAFWEILARHRGLG